MTTLPKIMTAPCVLIYYYMVSVDRVSDCWESNVMRIIFFSHVTAKDTTFWLVFDVAIKIFSV